MAAPVISTKNDGRFIDARRFLRLYDCKVKLKASNKIRFDAV
jgi:hypothetical protein